MPRKHDFDSARHAIGLLQNQGEEEQRRFIAGMSPMDALLFDADFEAWAHENQRPPNGEGWRLWLMMAGRGFGKTRAGAEWIYRLSNARGRTRIALVGATMAEARSIMVEGSSGILTVARRFRRRLTWEPSLGRLKWPNGSEAKLFSGDSADGLRGPEHDFAWCDEPAKWRQPEETWINVQMGLRRGSRPRALITTTTRPIDLLKRLEADLPATITTRGRTSDIINLDEKVIEVLTATYGGTRIGAQELDGVLLQDVQGALWTEAVIERCRVNPHTLGEGVVGSVQPASSRLDAYPPRPLPCREGRCLSGSSSVWTRRREPTRVRTLAGSWCAGRGARSSSCSRTRRCGGFRRKAGRTVSQRRQCAGEPIWLSPMRITAGPWSRAC